MVFLGNMVGDIQLFKQKLPNNKLMIRQIRIYYKFFFLTDWWYYLSREVLFCRIATGIEFRYFVLNVCQFVRLILWPFNVDQLKKKTPSIYREPRLWLCSLIYTCILTSLRLYIEIYILCKYTPHKITTALYISPSFVYII